MKNLSNEEMTQKGLEIIELFNLKLDKDGRVNTAWGTKTPLGLFLSLQTIINNMD